MARRKGQRALTGIVLLDKPNGISSNAALQRVRRLYGAEKAGHTGSLDPMATGMLPICFGEATKLAGWLLESDKHYCLTAKLGQKTSTGDTEGSLIEERSWQHITLAQIEAAITQMHGEHRQIPPMYSALKHQGQRLYELARAGEEIERQPRGITIYQLRLLRWSGDELELEVHCSKGTYVRVLAEDLAQSLGSCAHLTALRRLSTGPFTGDMVTLDQLQKQADEGRSLDDHVLPPQRALPGWPEVVVDAADQRRIQQGQSITSPQSFAPKTLVALLSAAGTLIAIARAEAGQRLAPQRLLQVLADCDATS